MIGIRRAYEPPRDSDGTRILVDRVWPRGVSREQGAIHEWLKEVAPSAELRKWFGHDPQRWEEFRRRYREELRENTELQRLREEAKKGKVTLVYGAKDEEHNNAVVLKELLEEHQVL